jgi:hypothetical protein
MSHIKTVEARLTHIHKTKILKRKLYTCPAVGNTRNKFNDRNLNKK